MKVSSLHDVVGKRGSHVAFIGVKGLPPEFSGTSGVEFYVEERALLLIAQGYRVTCYVRPWATPTATTSHRGINLIHLPTAHTKHLDAFIHSLISSIHVSLSDVSTVWYQAIGPAAFSFIPRLFGKRIIFTSHGTDWKRIKWGLLARLLLRLAEWIAVHQANIVIVVSEGLRKYYDQTFKVTCIVDSPKIVSKERTPPDIIRKKFGLKGDDYILYLGRFVPEKRIEWLIQAFNKIDIPGVSLVLAGGSGHSDEYVRCLMELARESRYRRERYGGRSSRGTRSRVIFTGWVFGREKAELLSNCRLFVLPSEMEGNPIALHEAYSYGKTCLVTDRLKHHAHRNLISFRNTYADFSSSLATYLKS